LEIRLGGWDQEVEYRPIAQFTTETPRFDRIAACPCSERYSAIFFEFLNILKKKGD
jgi:hypothetical protein